MFTQKVIEFLLDALFFKVSILIRSLYTVYIVSSHIMVNLYIYFITFPDLNFLEEISRYNKALLS